MKRLKQIVSSAIAITMLFSGVVNAETVINGCSFEKKPVTIEKTINEQGITDFVTRLYTLALQREPDSAGIEAWKNVLREEKATGISVAYGFIYSNEFQSRDVSNEDYVELMYQMFFGRASDPSGKSGWVNVLNSMDRESGRLDVFNGFANSNEFYNLCQTYGVLAGTFVPGANIDNTAKTNLFVQRLYNTVLGRDCDKQGMTDWSLALVNGSQSGVSVASGMFFSPEYENKHKTYSEYIDDLYLALMGREGDPAGKTSWLGVLWGLGMKESVFNGFALSAEFSSICSSYGINRGDPISETNNTTGTLRASEEFNGAVVMHAVNGVLNRPNDFDIKLTANPEFRSTRFTIQTSILFNGNQIYSYQASNTPESDGTIRLNFRSNILGSQKLFFDPGVYTFVFTSSDGNYYASTGVTVIASQGIGGSQQINSQFASRYSVYSVYQDAIDGYNRGNLALNILENVNITSCNPSGTERIATAIYRDCGYKDNTKFIIEIFYYPDGSNQATRLVGWECSPAYQNGTNVWFVSYGTPGTPLPNGMYQYAISYGNSRNEMHYEYIYVGS